NSWGSAINRDSRVGGGVDGMNVDWYTIDQSTECVAVVGTVPSYPGVSHERPDFASPLGAAAGRGAPPLRPRRRLAGRPQAAGLAGCVDRRGDVAVRPLPPPGRADRGVADDAAVLRADDRDGGVRALVAARQPPPLARPPAEPPGLRGAWGRRLLPVPP